MAAVTLTARAWHDLDPPNWVALAHAVPEQRGHLLYHPGVSWWRDICKRQALIICECGAIMTIVTMVELQAAESVWRGVIDALVRGAWTEFARFWTTGERL